MTAAMTAEGQITIPTQIRDSMGWHPGVEIDSAVNGDAAPVLRKMERMAAHKPSRFEAARGKAGVKWCAYELMEIL